MVPLPEKVWDENKDQAQVTPKQMGWLESEDYVVITEDGYCVFLNRETYRCAVYDHRPVICREMGHGDEMVMQCPYFNPDGTERTRAERRRFLRANGSKVRKIIRRYK